MSELPFQQMESAEFAVNFTVIDSPKHFRKALEENQLVNETIRRIQNQPNLQRQILRRLVKLLEVRHDQRYLHPQDTAIAVYLYILLKMNSRFTYDALDKIADSKNLWWPKRLTTSGKPTTLEKQVRPSPTTSDSVSVKWGQGGRQLDTLHFGRTPADLQAFLTSSASSESITAGAAIPTTSEDLAKVS